MSDHLAFLAGLSPMVFGIAAGTMANFGLELDRGALPPRHKVAAHLMILGLCGLLAWVLIEITRMTTELRALTGAAVGMLGARLAIRFRDWSDRQADQRLPLLPPPTSPGDQP